MRRNLLTVRQFAQRHPVFCEAACGGCCNRSLTPIPWTGRRGLSNGRSRPASGRSNGDGFGYCPIILLGFFAIQNANAERNHMNDIKLRSPHFPVGVLLVAKYRNVREVKVMMRRIAAA